MAVGYQSLGWENSHIEGGCGCAVELQTLLADLGRISTLFILSGGNLFIRLDAVGLYARPTALVESACFGVRLEKKVDGAVLGSCWRAYLYLTPCS